jgi:hypothetical protein
MLSSCGAGNRSYIRISMLDIVNSTACGWDVRDLAGRIHAAPVAEFDLNFLRMVERHDCKFSGNRKTGIKPRSLMDFPCAEIAEKCTPAVALSAATLALRAGGPALMFRARQGRQPPSRSAASRATGAEAVDGSGITP